ncbi:hypothetical protein VEE34_37440 [Escherichia coli]|nr:hypothetical protein VEE34_37440 [Escherichia coli]
MIDIVSQTEKSLPFLEENLRAHIKWKQHGGPCEIPNGLAFCAIHHKVFDKGSIGLDENMRVLVSGNDSNLLIVFYVQIMPDDFVMQLHRF